VILTEAFVCKQVEVPDAAQMVRFFVTPAVQRESPIDHRTSFNVRGAFAVQDISVRQSGFIKCKNQESVILAEVLVCKQVEVPDAARMVRFYVTPAVQRESPIDHRTSFNVRGAFAVHDI
jgi:hypothetical protein